MEYVSEMSEPRYRKLVFYYHHCRAAGVGVLFAIGFHRTRDSKVLRKLSSGLISALLVVIIAVVTIALGG